MNDFLRGFVVAMLIVAGWSVGYSIWATPAAPSNYGTITDGMHCGRTNTDGSQTEIPCKGSVATASEADTGGVMRALCYYRDKKTGTLNEITR